MDKYEIRHVRGHIEVFQNGRFQFSADTYGEAVRELDGFDEVIGYEQEGTN